MWLWEAPVRVLEQTREVGVGQECRSLHGMEQETGQISYRKGCQRQGACVYCQEAMQRTPQEK